VQLRDGGKIARAGKVECWILRNYSQELHVFHIHQTEFLIAKFSGTPDQILGGGLREVVNLPYAQNGKPGVEISGGRDGRGEPASSSSP
jgi:FtsP/CotA-like multicopper oxidase with cupredoxin domain